MAVTCVHDFILAMLGNHPELPHFHVNELLCKTFENMLCLELCDGDVQDQVNTDIYSIHIQNGMCPSLIRSMSKEVYRDKRIINIHFPFSIKLCKRCVNAMVLAYEYACLHIVYLTKVCNLSWKKFMVEKTV